MVCNYKRLLVIYAVEYMVRIKLGMWISGVPKGGHVVRVGRNLIDVF